MRDISVEVMNKPELDEVLMKNEHLLWSGHPDYGRRFFQAVGAERKIHLGFLAMAVAVWASFPFVDESALGGGAAVWVFGALTVGLVAGSFFLASQRQYVLSSFVYLVTDKRAIVCRRGRNWRFATRLYVISCPYSNTYPYVIIPDRPFPSLQIGTLLSENVVQPFGVGLPQPGHPALLSQITAPVRFDYVQNASELLDIIFEHTPTD
ncbi:MULTISPECIES: hypothetical protein [Rhodobacterales]|uniref:hypothetical protein n=1 Tax=Rhodobacterales TaxID=204455 RepID=UPI0011BE606A|nr:MULTISPECIES: hypothetical protein [Rhodobacterales]MDO6591057.1 hypothetical protein [Yoonia sp. 1_MG-2023]